MIWLDTQYMLINPYNTWVSLAFAHSSQENTVGRVIKKRICLLWY